MLANFAQPLRSRREPSSRKSQVAQFRYRFVGIAMEDCAHADGPRALDIGQCIVDEHGIARSEATGLASESVNGRIGFRTTDMARDDIIAKPSEKRVPKMGRSTQPGIHQRRRIREQVQRRAGMVQALDEFGHRCEGVIAHLVEAAVEGGDQSLLAGMKRLKFASGLARVAAAILGAVPFSRGHLGQKFLHLGRLWNQLAVQMTGVPIDQDTTQIEDRDLGAMRGFFRGQFGPFPG